MTFEKGYWRHSRAQGKDREMGATLCGGMLEQRGVIRFVAWLTPNWAAFKSVVKDTVSCSLSLQRRPNTRALYPVCSPLTSPKCQEQHTNK